MQWKNVWPACVLGVALAGLMLSSVAAEEKADAAKIDKLIEQLGSDSFKEREEATKALDALGEPALEKLEQALKSPDAEVRKRATMLVAKIGPRALSARVLRPTTVHLVYKDTPVKDAVADFAKKTGYPLVLLDPSGKLKDKKVTLDTGKTTFWDALDRFNAAAGLIEADPTAAATTPVVPGGTGAFPAPGGGRGFGGGAPPAAAPPAAGGKKLTEEELKKLKEALEKATREAAAKEAAAAAEREKLEERRREELIKRLKELEKKGAAVGGAPAGAPPLAARVAGALREEIAIPAGPGGPMAPTVSLFQHGKINLMPAPAVKVPSDVRSSVRVRVAPKAAAPAPAGRGFTLMLQATPEPRLRWQQLLGVTIDKAIDDNDQKLAASKEDMPSVTPVPPRAGFGGGGPGWAIARGSVVRAPDRAWSNDGVNYHFPINLERGDKESKKLKLLEGSLNVRFLSEAKPFIEVKDLMKAKGTTVKGTKGGSIEVTSVSKNADGSIQISFALEQPPDVVPEGQPSVNPYADVTPAMLMPAAGRAVFLPAPPVAAPAPARPVEKKAPADKPAEKKEEKKPAADEKPAAKKPEEKKPEAKAALKAAVKLAEIKVGVAGGPPGGGVVIGGGGVVVIGGPVGGPAMGFAPTSPYNFAVAGLSLQDDKGKTLPASFSVRYSRAAGLGAAIKAEFVVDYRPQPGRAAEPAKLVFTGREAMDITVPFRLENVDVK